MVRCNIHLKLFYELLLFRILRFLKDIYAYFKVIYIIAILQNGSQHHSVLVVNRIFKLAKIKYTYSQSK